MATTAFPINQPQVGDEPKAKPVKKAKPVAAEEPVETVDVKISIPVRRQEQLKVYQALEGLRARTTLETEALEAAAAAYSRKLAVLDSDEEIESRVREALDKKKGGK